MEKEFNNRFKNYENNFLLAHSTILDPRFKKLGYRDTDKFNSAVSQMKKALPVQTNRNGASNINNENEQGKAQKETLSMWADFHEKAKTFSAVFNPVAARIIECDKYLNEPLLPRNEDPFRILGIKKTYLLIFV